MHQRMRNQQEEMVKQRTHRVVLPLNAKSQDGFLLQPREYPKVLSAGTLVAVRFFMTHDVDKPWKHDVFSAVIHSVEVLVPKNTMSRLLDFEYRCSSVTQELDDESTKHLDDGYDSD